MSHHPWRPTLAAFALCGIAAAQSYVYSPALCATNEGNSLNAFPFGNTFHYQQVHGDLRGTPRVLKSLAWRRDGSDATAGQVARTLDFQMAMGEGDFATLTTTFASNYTSGPTTVYARKSLALPDHSVRPDAQPNAWDVNVVLDTPYVFLAQKDLVYEIVIWGTTAAGAYVCDAYAPGMLDGPFTSSGTGCSTAKGVMKLRSNLTSVRSTNAWTVSFALSGAPASAAAAVMVGIANPSLPLPGLCSGASLYTDAALFTAGGTTTAAGAIATLPSPELSVPFQAPLVGFTVTAQAVAVDPAQGGLGVAASNGNAASLPPLMPAPAVSIARLYAISSPTATTGMLSKTSGLVTRLEY